jgi:acetyl esterase/lipase
MVVSFILGMSLVSQGPEKQSVANLTLPEASLQWQSFVRQEDVIYGRKAGTALTLDVFRPKAKPNAAAIMLIVSSGWGSSHSAISPAWAEHFTKRGYVVFAVVHSSAPKFSIPELIPDVHRAVRFVRYKAKEFGINPNRIGATGASAGGHLALILGTQGSFGAVNSKDPIEREHSGVQCVACFFPPTDFNNFVGPNVHALDESVLKNYRKVIGAIPENIVERDALGRQISPIYSVTAKSAPTLIFHGEKDWNVLPHQSKSFVEALTNAGVAAKLVMKSGEGHGWKNMGVDIELCADWFDAHLN